MNRKSIVTLLAIAVTTPLWAADAPDSTTEAQPSTEQVIHQFRDDLQLRAADVMAKGLTLNAEEAAKFWPMFDAFQKEQKAIIDEQLASLVKYRDTYKTLSDADALAYANSLLTRDQKIHDLRVKYLAEYSKVLPPSKAARVIHLSRKLGFASQAKLADEIPLVR